MFQQHAWNNALRLPADAPRTWPSAFLALAELRLGYAGRYYVLFAQSVRLQNCN